MEKIAYTIENRGFEKDILEDYDFEPINDVIFIEGDRQNIKKLIRDNLMKVFSKGFVARAEDADLFFEIVDTIENDDYITVVDLCLLFGEVLEDAGMSTEFMVEKIMLEKCGYSIKTKSI